MNALPVNISVYINSTEQIEGITLIIWNLPYGIICQVLDGLWSYCQLQKVSMTVRVTKSSKYKQYVLYLKLLRVENIKQKNNLHISSSFQAVLECVETTTPYGNNRWPDQQLPRRLCARCSQYPGCCPSLLPLSWWLCNIHSKREIGRVWKNSSTQPSDLNHTLIRENHAS